MDKIKLYDREDRPWPNKRLVKAAIVGHTTETTTRLWTRVSKPGDYWLIVAKEPIPTDDTPIVVNPGTPEQAIENAGELAAIVFLEKKRFEYETDLTGVFDLTGLSGGARYYYSVFADAPRNNEAWEIARDEPHSFSTRNDAKETTTFGLYSCHMPFDGRNLANMHMWEYFGQTLTDTDADFVIGCGDQVYADGNKMVSIWRLLRKVKKEVQQKPPAEQIEIMKSWYRDIYRGYWGPLALRRVFRNYPTYMIWDDHEIMDGWGSYEDDELSDKLDSVWEWENQRKNLALAKKMFNAATQVYFEYQHAHNPKTSRDQWDYTFEWGPAAFFVMDMRGQRDFNRPTDDKVLGTGQMRRFQDWLLSSTAQQAEILFVVSPVPVVHVAEFVVNHFDFNFLGMADDLRDEWEHKSNWEERDKILDDVFKFSHKHNKRVAFLSGDVHIGAAFKLTRKNYPSARIYQLTSSAITYYLPQWKREALELLVRDNGDLGAPKLPNDATDEQRKAHEDRLTRFSLIHVFNRNNYGVIKMTPRENEDIKVSWELYGSTGKENEIIKLERVMLK